MIGYSLLGKQGALGNQLWEIAGTYGIAMSKGTTPIFPPWFYQPYFSVDPSFFGIADEGTEDLGENYLQDLRYWFPEHSHKIRSMFAESSISRELLDEAYFDLDWDNCSVVHVRRGNNLTDRYKNHHPSPGLDYFEQALDMLKVNHPFLVFSDDPSWCRKQSLFRNAIYGVGPPAGVNVLDLTKYEPVPAVEAALDLLAMARCGKAAVLSNSSFSWWGAFLSGAPKVVYPKRWYGEQLSHIDTSVMFSELGWTSL